MNKSTSALVSLAVVAGIAGGTSLTAQAHPAHAVESTAAHHASTVAQTRLQALLHAPSSAANRGFRPNDGGGLQH